MSSGMPYIPHSLLIHFHQLKPVFVRSHLHIWGFVRSWSLLGFGGLHATQLRCIQNRQTPEHMAPKGTKKQPRPLKETVLWEKLLSFRQPRGRWQLWKDIATEREINFAVRELQAKLGWSWASWNPPRQDMRPLNYRYTGDLACQLTHAQMWC